MSRSQLLPNSWLFSVCHINCWVQNRYQLTYACLSGLEPLILCDGVLQFEMSAPSFKREGVGTATTLHAPQHTSNSSQYPGYVVVRINYISGAILSLSLVNAVRSGLSSSPVCVGRRPWTDRTIFSSLVFHFWINPRNYWILFGQANCRSTEGAFCNTFLSSSPLPTIKIW
jgi:hypothetical protein